MVLFVLIMLVACSAQVHAEEKNTVGDSGAAVSMESTDDTVQPQESYAAVAAQLEAVARSHGRSSANQMLYTAFSSASEQDVAAASIPTAASESAVNVIVVPEEKTALSASETVLLLLTLLAVVGVMLAALRLHRRGQRRNVYKPMRAASAQNNPYSGYGLVRTYR